MSPALVCDESLFLWEDGGPLRNQAEEQEHVLHLRGAASNPEFVILVLAAEVVRARTTQELPPETRLAATLRACPVGSA